MMSMRTTLTLEDDLLRLARKRAAETDRTVKDVLNEALRIGLSRPGKTSSPRPTTVLPVHRGGVLQPGVNLDSNSDLLDRMDGL